MSTAKSNHPYWYFYLVLLRTYGSEGESGNIFVEPSNVDLGTCVGQVVSIIIGIVFEDERGDIVLEFDGYFANIYAEVSEERIDTFRNSSKVEIKEIVHCTNPCSTVFSHVFWYCYS